MYSQRTERKSEDAVAESAEERKKLEDADDPEQEEDSDDEEHDQDQLETGEGDDGDNNGKNSAAVSRIDSFVLRAARCSQETKTGSTSDKPQSRKRRRSAKELPPIDKAKAPQTWARTYSRRIITVKRKLRELAQICDIQSFVMTVETGTTNVRRFAALGRDGADDMLRAGYQPGVVKAVDNFVEQRNNPVLKLLSTAEPRELLSS